MIEQRKIMDLHYFHRVMMALEEDGLMAFFQDHGLLRRQLHCTTCSRHSSVLDNQVEEGNRCPLRLTLSFLPYQEEANNAHNVRRGASSHAGQLLALIYLWSYNQQPCQELLRPLSYSGFSTSGV